MNATSVPQCKSTRRKVMLAWSVSIVAVTLLLSVSVSILMTMKTGSSEKRRLLPRGQFQADARTLFAAVNYLLENDMNSAWPGATITAYPTNFATQPITSATFCCLSNQAELFSDSISNGPARS